MEKKECIALIAVKCEVSRDKKLEYLEKMQEKYIRYNAKAHHIVIAYVVHSRGLGQMEVNRRFHQIVDLIQRRKADGIIVVNMLAISSNMIDAYTKVGKVRSAGGVLVTVEEGDLRLKIKRRNCNGK